jgi:GT2 family glycosyltransferase
MQAHKVDILIRGYNNQALTYACIASIIRNTPPELCRVTYVDNGSDVPAFNHLVKSFPGMTFIRFPVNYGSVTAINAGLALSLMSPAEFILLLDNDTEIPAGDSDWLPRWLAYFDDSEVGAAGATTNYVAGYQHTESMPDTYTKDWQEEDGRGGVKEPPSVPVLVSFAMMFRKSVFEEVGMFDERFNPGMAEDYDYTLRIRQAGYKCVVANSVWIHHAGSQTFSKHFDFNALLKASYEKLIDKWSIEGLKALGLELQEAT